MYNGIILTLPEIIISIMSCFILITDLFISNKKKYINYYLTQITLIITISSLIHIAYYYNEGKFSLFYGAYIFDFYGIVLKTIIMSRMLTV
jgi:NADH:ubiquinone oxidoreductase subunit 2 (subunit N)